MELFPGVFLPVVSRTEEATSKLIWIDKGSQRSRRQHSDGLEERQPTN
jgi:hypothetical protein